MTGRVLGFDRLPVIGAVPVGRIAAGIGENDRGSDSFFQGFNLKSL